MIPQKNRAEIKTSSVWTKRLIYAAFGWAVAFALMSFYWALGGTFGTETLGNVFTDSTLINDPGFIAFVWLTGFLKVAGGLLVLAVVQSWGRLIPRRLLLTMVGGGGIILLLYAVALLVQHGLMEIGVVNIFASLGSKETVRWHLLLWDPWWLPGGMLFMASAYLSKS